MALDLISNTVNGVTNTATSILTPPTTAPSPATSSPTSAPVPAPAPAPAPALTTAAPASTTALVTTTPKAASTPTVTTSAPSAETTPSTAKPSSTNSPTDTTSGGDTSVTSSPVSDVTNDDAATPQGPTTGGDSSPPQSGATVASVDSASSSFQPANSSSATPAPLSALAKDEGGKADRSSNALTPEATPEATPGSMGAGAIAGVMAGLMVVLLLAAFVIRRRRAIQNSKSKSLSTPTDDVQGHTHEGSTTVGVDDMAGSYSSLQSTKDHVIKIGSQPTLQHSTSSMSDDPVITTIRIPMEKIEVGEVISRGGYGEVYRGTYKGEVVAIKRLLPERRRELRQIDAFLAEAKMMGTLEHERIVRFVGVAWDALSDLCVVSEFMYGGDLRSALSRWGTVDCRPQGFDEDKVKISLHIAHALTYLHSLQPIVLHRDLKSKNILLTADYDAKITDFGVSRECQDATMTAGVGSSLWMAPEVMMGDHYDEKADVFSYGIVLSELDTHAMPYAHAKETGSGNKLTELAVMQLVSLGRLTAQFSPDADVAMVALARECLQLDPQLRPTASEILYRVHKIYTRDTSTLV